MTTMNNEDMADQSVHEQRELPEPAAWIDNVDLRGTLPDDGWCVVHSAPCDPCCEHNAYEPLYTADQMRAAIAAERERSHELLQAADHIRAGLEAKVAALSAALAEKEQPK